MLSNIDIKKILFLDIETVPIVYKYSDLDDVARELWDSKSSYMLKEGVTCESLYEKAAVYSEFGKIVCISVGFVNEKDGKREIRTKSFCGEDEKKILEEFIKLLDTSYNTSSHLLCGHNGREFDFPYISRRILINGLKLPFLLDIAGSKPWEINHLDTMELWKFGDYKHYTSLKLLTHIFNIPSPKDDISGADVGRVFWEEKDYKRISVYCEKDVVATIQLFLRYRGEPVVEEGNIISVDN